MLSNGCEARVLPTHVAGKVFVFHVERRVFFAGRVGLGICEMIAWIMSLCVIFAWIVRVLWKSHRVSGKVKSQARYGSQLMGLRRDDALRHRRRPREKMDFAIFVSD